MVHHSVQSAKKLYKCSNFWSNQILWMSSTRNEGTSTRRFVILNTFLVCSLHCHLLIFRPCTAKVRASLFQKVVYQYDHDFLWSIRPLNWYPVSSHISNNYIQIFMIRNTDVKSALTEKHFERYLLLFLTSPIVVSILHRLIMINMKYVFYQTHTMQYDQPKKDSYSTVNFMQSKIPSFCKAKIFFISM